MWSFSNIRLFYLDVVWFGRWPEPWNLKTSHFRILYSFPPRISALILLHTKIDDFLYFNIISIIWQLLLSVKWRHLFSYEVKSGPIYGVETNIKSGNGWFKVNSIQHYVIKFVSDLWLSLCTTVSSTNKTDRSDMTELLLKVRLSTQ
jgi:hypothetical protein